MSPGIKALVRFPTLPTPNEAAAERKCDLTFGNQTFRRLGHALEARRLCAELLDLSRDDQIYRLSYRPSR
ncbi:hypothetical protein NLM27_42255 [Bradyrhizobium sp. CCGB12]|uniref:hypothetical protein n=1 Tax=Bradyrhizobium sp. CCGB12 TaxID=2949632 RepID=UPI0020B188F6|nr:hypothetical protein [Bradyrhizobium sp. CCGB12]MCP3395354.1 hypothetical protein [Bradyrhizobium sp. CCGB12]